MDSVTYYQYPVYDHRGSVARLMDDGGTPVAYYEYNAWGVPLREEETGAPSRFGYQTNWIVLGDSNGKLLLSPRRVYHTGLARFLQREPVRYETRPQAPDALGRGERSR